MKRKTSLLSLFLLVFPIFAAAQEPGYPQVDTLVLRRDSLDTARGVIRSIPDTIYFTYSADAIFTKKVSLEEEMTFSPIRIVDTPIAPMVHLADPVERLARARSCRLSYHFDEALKACQQALMWADDAQAAEIEAEYSLILNAMSLSDNCQTPVAVMKKQFSLKDFYLYFPFADRSFRNTPNVFDSGDGLIPTYAPKNCKTVYFSAPDDGGTRDIYMSEDRDSCWSAPVLINESMVTIGNEIAPVLSPDGKTLYFASDALYGMGGYDLYKCQWEEETRSWGEPVNLGFPFSSPADDYMIMESEDGKYILFASNRECHGSENVYIYVIQHEADPATKSVTDPGGTGPDRQYRHRHVERGTEFRNPLHGGFCKDGGTPRHHRPAERRYRQTGRPACLRGGRTHPGEYSQGNRRKEGRKAEGRKGVGGPLR